MEEIHPIVSACEQDSVVSEWFGNGSRLALNALKAVAFADRLVQAAHHVLGREMPEAPVVGRLGLEHEIRLVNKGE